MNEIIECLCGNKYDTNNFKKHFKKCNFFKKEFIEFDNKICLFLKEYSDKKEYLIFFKFLFKRYIKLIDYKLNNNNNEDNDKNNNYKKYKEQYKNIINEIKNLFLYEMKEKEIIQILMNINFYSNLTIFEFMNSLYREVQIIKAINLNKLNKPRKYGPDNDIDIFEEKYISYSNKDLQNVIKNYKIFNENKDMQKYWLYNDNSDKRRKIKKDEDNNYNYIPLLKKDIINSNDSMYAQNENELLYHPLYYKTIICKYCNLSNDNNSEENILCPYAHNILNDFRLIYDYRDEKIIKFMLLLQNSKLFKFVNYLNYIPWYLNKSVDFNIDYFKVHQCRNDLNCKEIKKGLLCPYYHKNLEGDEYRRPPLLFRYKSEKCKHYLNKKDCESGYYCQFSHNENEYNYHPDILRKEIECQNKNIKGHSEQNQNFDIDDKIIFDENEFKNKENIKEEKNNIIKCRKCQNKRKYYNICYFFDCKHFLCFDCFEKLSKKNKKEGNKNIILYCPFCKKKIKKKIFFYIDISTN